VRERTLVAALAAILDIVVDWVVVGGERLEGGEVRLGHGAARDVEIARRGRDPRSSGSAESDAGGRGRNSRSWRFRE